jgi:glycosyltransferase involved in cell wall biosynthesis
VGDIEDRALRVLQSFPEARATTNPYLVLLRRSLGELPEVEVRTFSWRRALREGHDVFHVHWPEILLQGRSRPKTAARRALTVLLLLRLWATRTAVVRTVHNVRPHEGVARLDRFLLRAFDRRTALYVRLNDQTPLPSSAPAVDVPHGHYRDWFAGQQRQVADPYRVAFVGRVLAYKNVDGLLAAFADAAATEPRARLDVAGAPAGDVDTGALRAAADQLPGASLRLAHVTDDELVTLVTGAVLVALPYREMHNSGAALLALSLDRPVLVPDNAVNRELAAEVGEDWVHRYPGELTGAALLEALAAARALPPGSRPDLHRRDWPAAAQAHLAAYRRAVGGHRR